MVYAEGGLWPGSCTGQKLLLVIPCRTQDERESLERREMPDQIPGVGIVAVDEKAADMAVFLAGHCHKDQPDRLTLTGRGAGITSHPNANIRSRFLRTASAMAAAVSALTAVYCSIMAGSTPSTSVFTVLL